MSDDLLALKVALDNADRADTEFAASDMKTLAAEIRRLQAARYVIVTRTEGGGGGREDTIS